MRAPKKLRTVTVHLLRTLVALALTASSFSLAAADYCGGSGSCSAPSSQRPVWLGYCTIPTVIVGTPLGPLSTNPDGYTLAIHDLGDDPSPEGLEIWISFTSSTAPVTVNSPGSLKCDHTCNELVEWPYLEAELDSNGEVNFKPAFSGAGTATVQYEWDCVGIHDLEDYTQPEESPGPGYFDIGAPGSVELRSTDRVGNPYTTFTTTGDGDTDQQDKINFGLLLRSGAAGTSYDYDVDGDRDANDYRIVAAQHALESTVQAFCASQGGSSGEPFEADTLAPSTFTLTKDCEGTDWFLQWNAPGDVYDGTYQLGAAMSYEIRYSSSSITAGNFSSATLFSGAPAPALAGTAESVNIGPYDTAKKYWAIKSKDHHNRLSAMSNVVIIPNAECLGSSARPAIDEGDPNTPGVAQLNLAPLGIGAFRSSAAMRFVIPGDRPVAARLTIVDASGRHVRTLVEGDVAPGRHQVSWDLLDAEGAPVSSGVYFASLRAGQARVSCPVAVTR